jgi:cytochrome c oxidase accessory protein FixG
MSHQAIPESGDQYRDSVSLVDKKTGDRQWVYPKKPKGKLTHWRSIVSWILIGGLLIGPFLQYNGHPVFLFNILDRKFIFFGIPFWPQDLPLFALLMVTFVVFIIVFTVLFGRIWCGWACPQTIFMEMLFRKIEYWIEGDFKQQQKLDDQPWNTNKISKKSAKHFIFFSLAVLIANTFLSYLIGWKQVELLIEDGPAVHIGTFVSLILFSGLFYLIFAKIREIVCIVICPYGRLQGLMLDKNTIVVAYDYLRGEPRGIRRKNIEQNLGDCVDCNRCVQVCPTGIDIRNGTQLECVNCTACIDECNDVLQKMNKPEGLIRYASKEQIEKGTIKRLTTRSKAYIGVLLFLTANLIFFLGTRHPIDATFLRTPGMLYQQQTEDSISNMYNFEVINKTFDKSIIEFKLNKPANATIKMVDRPSLVNEIAEDGILTGSFFIILHQNDIRKNNTPANIQVFRDGVLMEEIETNFVGPVKMNSK